MKKHIALLWAVFAVLLAACQSTEAEAPALETAVPAVVPTVIVTEPPVETTLPPETEMTQPQPTEPRHSEFYIPGIPVEDVIRYFNEVCLDAEIVNAGDPSVLQKWTVPIEYTLNGNFTSDDLSVFNDFVQWLNTVVGFPGMYASSWPEDAPLQIYFCTEEEMVSRMGKSFRGHDGAVTFWYNSENEIYKASVCYRTEISQYTRNSVILEEIYNGLGPIQDTQLRPDSIIYTGFSEPQYLTEMDELILRLLYHPWMECGMDAESCAAVIRQLYY